MASVTLTGEQWKALKRQYPQGAAAGGSVVIDVTGSDLTVTWYPLPAAAGVSFMNRKSGTNGEKKP